MLVDDTTSKDSAAPLDLSARAEQIAREVVAPAAFEVDRTASFPTEAVDALRGAHMLSALVPKGLGGEGASISEVARATTVLGRSCASTAMIFAMHQIQVACLVNHGHTELIDGLLERIVDEQLLFASATTELGIGGDVRRSSCYVERDGDSFRLTKQSPVISYGAYAYGVLATARRTEESPPSDQVLVACLPPGLNLNQIGEWDTLGFRGTCSNGFVLNAEGPTDAILADPYGDISSQTMLPVSHILWGSVWLGIATEAANRARRYVQSEARKTPGTTPPSAMRLAELYPSLIEMGELVRGLTQRYEDLQDNRESLASVDSAIAFNGLKLSCSRYVEEIVHKAMTICGMAGYRNDSPYSLGRLMRDAQGAALMVNNDRILANDAQLLLVHREG
jgi:acyl-CoA dehydrogenase